MTHLRDEYGNWVFIAPLKGLRLTKAVNHEVVIERVTFVSREKLPRIRKRLGLPVRLSQMREARFLMNLLQNCRTCAVLRHSGTPAGLETTCTKVVDEAAAIISASRLFRGKRAGSARIEMATGDPRRFRGHVFVNAKKPSWLSWQGLVGYQELSLDARWVSFHKHFFFLKLLDILNCRIQVSSRWRNTLRRATILVGKSLNTQELGDAFLWMMIAMEMLLTQRGEKCSEVLPTRCEALLSSWPTWRRENLSSRIDELYKIRCAYVHDGRDDLIKGETLAVADKLLFNLFVNLVRNVDVFQKKGDLIEYARRYEAARLLSTGKKYACKRLRFLG